MCEAEEVTLHKSRLSWVRNGLDGLGGRKHSGAQLYNIQAIHLYYSVVSSGSMNIMLLYLAISKHFLSNLKCMVFTCLSLCIACVLKYAVTLYSLYSTASKVF